MGSAELGTVAVMRGHVITLNGHHIVTHVKHLGVRHVGVLIAVHKIALPALGIDIGLGLALLIQVGSILLSFLNSDLVLHSVLLGEQVVVHLTVTGCRLQVLGRCAKRKKGYRRQGEK